MGFALFTASGTFNPLTYGLTVGDVIHIKVVGGGGGGSRAYSQSSTSYAGTAGGASSFGSILTAAGGLGGVCNAKNPGIVAGSSTAMCPVAFTMGSRTYYCGGSGGHGWHPKYGSLAAVLPAALYLPTVFQSISGTSSSISLYTSMPLANDSGADRAFNFMGIPIAYSYSSTVSAVATASTQPWGNPGYVSGNDSYHHFSAGGVGYGAGGGSGGGPTHSSYGWGTGGNGGVVADKDYVLTNTNSIAVTVGTGGAGYSSYGGGGANGCVAIWW